ncbi:hypothetical protein Tco_0205851 [Tanacetum coccineum]
MDLWSIVIIDFVVEMNAHRAEEILSTDVSCRLGERSERFDQTSFHEARNVHLDHGRYDEVNQTGSTALEATIATGIWVETVHGGRLVTHKTMVTTGSHNLSWMVEHMVLEKLIFARDLLLCSTCRALFMCLKRALFRSKFYQDHLSVDLCVESNIKFDPRSIITTVGTWELRELKPESAYAAVYQPLVTSVHLLLRILPLLLRAEIAVVRRSRQHNECRIGRELLRKSSATDISWKIMISSSTLVDCGSAVLEGYPFNAVRWISDRMK